MTLEEGALHLYTCLGKSLLTLRDLAKHGCRRSEHVRAKINRWISSNKRNRFWQSDAEEETWKALLQPFGHLEAYLGGGSFGTVFKATRRGRPVAIKLTPYVPSAWGSLGHASEYEMQKRFAALGLAFMPICARNRKAMAGEGLKLKGSLREILRFNVGGIVMPIVEGTLVDICRRGHVAGLQDAVTSLLRAARVGGMVHNDLKCNNVGYLLSPMLDIRYLDLARSYDVATLQDKGHSPEDAEQLVAMGVALDSMCLLASARRHLAAGNRGMTQVTAAAEMHLLELGYRDNDDDAVRKLNARVSFCLYKKPQKG